MKWLVLALAITLSAIVVPLLRIAYDESFFVYAVEALFSSLIVATGFLIIQEREKKFND